MKGSPIFVSEGPHNVLLRALRADFMVLSKLLHFVYLVKWNKVEKAEL
jgi:hypothetical protein